MAISGTKTNSSLTLKELNCFLTCVALPSLRIAALTEKPASRNVFNVHAPMNPFVPVMKTFPEEIAGMLNEIRILCCGWVGVWMVVLIIVALLHCLIYPPAGSAVGGSKACAPD